MATNPPITIGPFANVPAPGSGVKSDWAQTISTYVAGMVQSGTYTPALVNANIGSGGAAANSAYYHFVGAPGVGGKGIMSVVGALTLGASGFSMVGPVEIGLPPGFAAGQVSTLSPPVGNLNLQGAPGELSGYFHFLGNTSRLQAYYWSVAGAVIGRTLVSTNAPFVWAAGNGMRWSATVPMVRV